MGFNREPSAVWHSVSRVDAQVNDRLGNLIRVHHRRGDFGLQIQIDFNVLWKSLAEKLSDVFNEYVEIGNFKLGIGLLRHRKELAHQRSSSLGHILDGADRVRHRLSLACLFQ